MLNDELRLKGKVSWNQMLLLVLFFRKPLRNYIKNNKNMFSSCLNHIFLDVDVEYDYFWGCCALKMGGVKPEPPGSLENVTCMNMCMYNKFVVGFCSVLVT